MEMKNKSMIAEDILRAGGKSFEFFWLRPKKMASKEAVVRMKINKKWGGWKLKDGLVQSLGLVVGDTINTEVSILFAPDLIDDASDTDLFASGKGADWLLDNDVGYGSIIDAKVRFVYSKAPVGGLEGKEVWKISLVFVEGYGIVKERNVSPSVDSAFSSVDTPAMKTLRQILAGYPVAMTPTSEKPEKFVVSEHKA